MCHRSASYRLHKTDFVVQARTFRIGQHDLKVRLNAFEKNAGARYRPSCSCSAHECVYTAIGLSPDLRSLNIVSIEHPGWSVGSPTCTRKVSLEVALILK